MDATHANRREYLAFRHTYKYRLKREEKRNREQNQNIAWSDLDRRRKEMNEKKKRMKRPEAKNQITLDANLNKYFTNQSASVKGTPVFTSLLFFFECTRNVLWNSQAKMPRLWENGALSTLHVYVRWRVVFLFMHEYADILVSHLIFHPLDYSSHRQRAHVFSSTTSIFFSSLCFAYFFAKSVFFSSRQFVYALEKLSNCNSMRNQYANIILLFRLTGGRFVCRSFFRGLRQQVLLVVQQ